MFFIYLSFFLGARKLWGQPILYFVLTIILTNCLLIGIATVDWDNRFYIPMEPGIVVICGGGMAYLKNMFAERIREMKLASLKKDIDHD
jgi:hypothetical protein